MAIHDFSRVPKQIVGGEPKAESVPIIPALVPNAPNLAKVDAKAFDTNNVEASDVTSFVQAGFDTMDRGVKEYFGELKIPTKDGTKPLTVRVAGGDKSILYWKQELEGGRIQLPVMSVNRGSWRFNPQKFSHPTMPAYRRFADRDGTRMVVTPREWPCLIDYTLSIWTERKRDMEYAQYQIVTRFNPLAEWRVADEYMTGLIIAKLNSVTDASDKEAAPDTLAKVRYDISITIEGWLSLPGKITPTVLGSVQVLQEFNGEVFDALP